MKNSNQKNVKVAVVQAAPVIMDQEKTMTKLNSLAAKAAAAGAEIVVFPEAFIPAYPRGLSFKTKVGSRSKEGKEDWFRYWENSVQVPGKITARLANLAQENNIYLVVGVIEKEVGAKRTLYCTVLYFSPEGNLVGKHQKLKPTGSERYIWGEGDGSTLTAIETPYGKLGGLICWENYMPLARAAMYAKGVKIYVAPTADSREEWQSTMRHIALEGRCFVLACNQFVTKAMYPSDLACYDELETEPDLMCRGGSAIIAPTGEYIAGPVYDQEEILYADLDLSLITKSSFDFDVNGHYSRPDVFQLIVNEKEQKNVKWQK